tara:strand:- start:845 stop:2023 length:1179 start_codon:yes stop_codon:yes gene_type:complete
MTTTKKAAVILSIIFAFLIGLEMGMKYDKPDQVANQKQELKLDHLNEVWDLINEKYFNKREIENNLAENYAIKGVVSSLNDPYSIYLTKDEFKEFSQSLDSEIHGIGAAVTKQDGFIMIESPLKESPAIKAGLVAKDKIIAINGESTEGLTVTEAVMKIRGKKGTSVTLTIYREEADEPFDVTIIRDEIKLESVSYKELDEEIAYIAINQFSDDTLKEFYEAGLDALLADSKGLILDLRFNGGGYLQIAQNLISYFVGPEKVALQVLDANNNSEAKLTNNKAIFKDIPLVILINQGSASASEIVAGSLQDYKKAILVGNQTYGKGTIQQLLEFTNGSSLKLTIAKWLTANGRDIDEIGLTPDFEISITQTDILNNIDSQLEKAKEIIKDKIN